MGNPMLRAKRPRPPYTHERPDTRPHYGARRSYGRDEPLSRAERVLIEVSRLLLRRDVKAQALLRVIGEALDAERVYLITAPLDHRPRDMNTTIQEILTQKEEPNEPGVLEKLRQMERAEGGLNLDAWTSHEWKASNDRGRETNFPKNVDDSSSLAVPLLSQQDQCYGYLRIDYGAEAPAQIGQDRRVLHVLGDMLSTYLERQMAETALERSEERYWSFVETVAEGIWCAEIVPPLDTNGPPGKQLSALRERGVITECNAHMADALEEQDPSSVIGRNVSAVIEERFEGSLFSDFLAHDYCLRHHEYSLCCNGEAPRHFMLNAIGTVEQGRLVRIWGSCADVTERTELEHRMVKALEQQQERTGQELHDGVGQLLTSIRMLSQNLIEHHVADGTGSGDEKQQERARKILHFTQEASRLVGRLQRGLAPQIHDGGLPDALAELARSTDELSNVTCTFARDGAAESMGRETQLQLYRITQEAINNALKHARPSTIRILLTADNSQLVLEVQDDGDGFDPSAQDGSSLGLHSMRHRAHTVGATLALDSRPGAGTTLRCVLPRSVA